MVIIGGIGAELLTILFLWREHSKPLLSAWFITLLVLALCRYITLRKFRNSRLSNTNYARWARLSLFWTVIWGMHWGILPVFIMHSEMSLYTMCVVVVYTGFTASSVSSSAALFRNFLAFTLPATISLVGRFVYEGGNLYLIFAAMITFYFALNIMLARNSERLFISARKLNYENLALMQELEVKKEAAETATRSKDKFLAAASHDLRQPLHASGLLLSALEDYVNHNKGKQLLQEIHQTNNALNQSFNSLLDLSRLDAGVIKVNKIHFDLRSVIERTVKRLSPLAQEKGLVLKIECCGLTVYSDPIIVEQILYNLVSNAINHTRHGKVAIIADHSPDNRVRLRVSDTGVGIDDENLEEIFSEYYQAGNPERDRKKGFGLGLAIVSRMVTILESAIYVCSQTNQGSTFALYLEPGDADRLPKLVETDPLSTRVNDELFVLVIDDDNAILKSMKTLLTSWGWQVACAESGPAAIELLGEAGVPPDVIVADYRLRDFETGDQAIKAVRDEFNHDIPAVVVTGDTSKNRLLNLTQVGHKVLHKPVPPALLRATIINVLGDHSSSD